MFIRDVSQMVGRNGASVHVDARNDDKTIFINKFQKFSIVVSAEILSCFKHLDEIDGGGDAFRFRAVDASAEEDGLLVWLVADV